MFKLKCFSAQSFNSGSVLMRAYFILVAGLSLSFASCSSADKSMQLLSGQSQAVEIKQQLGVLIDSDQSGYLRGLVSKLVSGNSKFNGRPIRVSILNSANPLALSSPSGEILLSAGLVKNFSSESQLAFILAHEIAHVEHGHTVASADPAEAFSISQELELEADRLGLEIIMQRGYDPRQAILALAQIYRLSGVNVDAHSHPDFSKRAFQLQNIMLRSETNYFSNSAEREFNRFLQSL